MAVATVTAAAVPTALRCGAAVLRLALRMRRRARRRIRRLVRLALLGVDPVRRRGPVMVLPPLTAVAVRLAFRGSLLLR